jgi:trk system potassium uptake protein TrkA
MRIIILGAGRVGESVAESLVSEQNDITLIDPDPDRLRDLEDRLDLRGVPGNGIQPSVLRRAGAEDADLFIACASLDETNLAACKVAHDVFGIPTTVARLRSPEFEAGEALLSKTGFAVDHVICPEESVMHYIHKLIEFPEALQVLEFSQGRAHLIAVRVTDGSPLANHTISEFKERYPGVTMRVVAVYRKEADLPIEPGTRVQPGDEVFVLADKEKIRHVLRAIHKDDRPVRRVMIAGGGRVGLRLARSLAGQYAVKLIDRDLKRCKYLAGELPSDLLVLEGDAADDGLRG